VPVSTAVESSEILSVPLPSVVSIDPPAGDENLF